VALPIPRFVSFEVGGVDVLRRVGLLTTLRHGSLIAVFRMKFVIHVANEAFGAMKPWAGANEDTPIEPFRSVVAIGRASIGRHVIVTIRTVGGYSDLDANLSLGNGSGGREADYGDCN